MDILLNLLTVSLESESIKDNESSEVIRSRVMKARERQYARYDQATLNGTVAPEFMLEHGELGSEQRNILQQAASKQHWSTRVQMKIIRLARTISDLNGNENITSEALWEAMTLRRMPKLTESKSLRR